MLLALIGALFGLLAAALTAVIVVHAFGRSFGTGVLVLCVPAYVLYYAVSQIEHPRKPLLISVWLVAIVLSSVLLPLGIARA